MKKRILSICLVFCLVLTLVPVSAQAASVTGRSNETVVCDYLVNTMGLNSAAACGVLACISKESGFSPTAGSSYYGLCQWGSSRKTKLMNYCSSNGYDYTTLTGQLHFLEYELNNTYSSVGSYLRSVSNDTAGAYKAGYYFSYYYLIPGNRETTSVSRGCLAMNTYCPVYGVSTDTDPCASGHTLVTKNAKAATCVSEGYTGDKVCAICGKTVEKGSTIAVTDHTATTVNAKAATCTSEGYTGDTVCSVCGVTLSTGSTIEALGHEWGEWTVTTAATCMEEGVETRVCTHDSSHTETRTIEIVDHETELVGQCDADWIRDGYTGDLVCTMCGEVITQGEVIPAVGNGRDISLFISGEEDLEALSAADLARLLLAASDSQLVVALQGSSWTLESLIEALEAAQSES